MVKRNEKKVVVALSIALLLVFSMVASIIPAVKSEAAAPTFNGTISVTIPPVGSTLDQSTFGNYIAIERTPAADAYIVAASRPPSLDEVNEWLLGTLNSGSSYVTPSWGYPSDYSTTVEAGKDYYFVYVFFADTLFNEDSTVTVNGATDQNFLGVKNNSTGTGDLGLMAGWVKVSIPGDPSSDTSVDPVTPSSDTPVDSGTSSTSASTDTNTVPATDQVTPSADTTSNTTKATAPKTEDALPIVLIISIIGAGALTSVITIVSRKRQ